MFFSVQDPTQCKFFKWLDDAKMGSDPNFGDRSYGAGGTGPSTGGGAGGGPARDTSQDTCYICQQTGVFDQLYGPLRSNPAWAYMLSIQYTESVAAPSSAPSTVEHRCSFAM